MAAMTTISASSPAAIECLAQKPFPFPHAWKGVPSTIRSERSLNQQWSRRLGRQISINSVSYLLGTFGACYGIWRAYELRWLSDDAFITYRYADNYLSGLGFVFNAGERVEGYTHVLWLFVITFLQWVGVSPELATLWIGLAAQASTLILFLWVSYRVDSSGRFVIPFVAIALGLHFDFAVWGTGGLETSTFTFLVSLGIVLICYSRAKSSSRFFFSGIIFSLLVLLRPDGLVFLCIAFAFLVFTELAGNASLRETMRLAGYFFAPVAVLLVPTMAWKIWYYGYLMPNTYYAKSGGLSYFKQGFFYIWTYVRGYPSTLLVFLVIPFLVSRWLASSTTTMRGRLHDMFMEPNVRMVILGVASLLTYGIFFVARVGGDFMYARFIHPMIPLIYLMIGVSLVGLLGRHRKVLHFLMVAACLVVWTDKMRRESQLGSTAGFGPGAFDSSSWIIDERWYWTHDLGNGENLMQRYSRVGQELRSYFEGLDVTVVLWGQNSLAYYAKFRRCIESAGLTDSYIAHLPLEHRNRPGHEKLAPWKYQVARHANFVLLQKSTDTTEFRRFSIRCGSDSVWGYMITYDHDLLIELERRSEGQFSYVRFEQYLDRYIEQTNTKGTDEVRSDLKVFDDYYFNWTSDNPRRQALQVYVESHVTTSDAPGTSAR